MTPRKPRVRWTQLSQRDLLAIGAYIAADDPTAARGWVAKLKAKAHAAALTPMAGRAVPELGRIDVREVRVRSYRIVYRVERGGISVITAFEGHRLFQPDDTEDSE